MIITAESERTDSSLERDLAPGFPRKQPEACRLAGLARPRLRGLGGPSDQAPSEPRHDRFFGVQAHFGQYRPGVDKLLDVIRNAGIGWIRDEVYWSEVEKEKGVFRFPPSYDYYLEAAGRDASKPFSFSTSATLSIRARTSAPLRPAPSFKLLAAIAGRSSRTTRPGASDTLRSGTSRTLRPSGNLNPIQKTMSGSLKSFIEFARKLIPKRPFWAAPPRALTSISLAA